MAIDPNQIAADQNQLSALASQGMPTEFAEDPANSVKVAGGGYAAMKAVLNRLDPKVNTPREVVVTPPGGAAVAADDTVGSVDPEVKTTLPSRVPTAMELRTVPDAGQYNETATKAMLAPEVLSPAGQAKFKAQGYRAITDQPPEVEKITSAQQALDALDADEGVAESAVDVNELARRAITADKLGFNPETAVVSDEVADAILARTARNDDNIKTLAKGGDFNFDYIDTEDDVLKVITAVGEELSDEQQLLKRGKFTNAETINEAAGILADEIGFTRELLSSKIGEGSMTAAQFVAGRTILVQSGEKLADLATKIKKGTADAGDRLRFRRQLAIHQGIQLQLKGKQTEAARALQSFQIKVDGELDLDRFNEEAALMMADSGDAGVTDELAKKLLGAIDKNGSMQTINTFAKIGWDAKTSQMVSEAYLAGLLSSPPTQMKNIIGTASFMAYQIPAEIIAGMAGAVVRTGQKTLGEGYPINPDQVYVADAALRLKGWADSYRDALRAASIAYKTEMPSGGKSKLDVDQYTAITGSPNSENVLQRGITELGKRMRIPFNLLLAGDEFFKTISQRGELYTKANRAYQTAIREGKTVVEAQDEAGMVLLDPKSVSEELDLKAKFDTLQSDLGSFGKSTSSFQRLQIMGLPVGRFLLPFATAPTNDAIRTTEFIPFNPEFWKLLFEGTPKQRQLSFGKMAVGGTTMFIVGQHAMDGSITGAMPSDKKLREKFIAAGKKPYSFVVKKEGFPEGMPPFDKYGRPNGPLRYVSYNGFGPASSLIGLVANTMQRAVLTRDPELRNNYFSAAVFGAAEYFTELPMLQGLADFQMMMDSVKREDGVGAVSQLMRGPAEAATKFGVPSPFSAAQRGIARTIDPTVVRPKEDIEYYTMADMLLTVDNPDGTSTLKYDNFGEPNYALVGTPKNDDWAWIHTLSSKMNALQSKDSVFGLVNPAMGERASNTIIYDTMGNAYGAEDFSLANNAQIAVFNSVSGIKINDGKPLTAVESELIKISTLTNNWPLTNPETMGGLQLSTGDQMLLVNQAKNITEVRDYGYESFRDALGTLFSSPEYDESSIKSRVTMIKALNTAYLNQAFDQIIEQSGNEKLLLAVQDRAEAKAKLEAIEKGQ